VRLESIVWCMRATALRIALSLSRRAAPRVYVRMCE
jgi:hypothetical protein